MDAAVPTSPKSIANANANSFEFRDLSVTTLLGEFAAGKEVPGSGSANALSCAIAACLVASVAVKTRTAKDTKYVHVQQTAVDVERGATRIAQKLLELVERDSTVFAPVIALRRETQRIDEPILQDASLRKEVDALKPATEIPIEIARLALETAHLAKVMLDSGFAAARGESYTALVQATAAIDGAVYVAKMNIRTVRNRIQRLNDPELEGDWIQRMVRDLTEIRARWTELREDEQARRETLDAETFAKAPAKKKRKRLQR